jgi:UDP-N-acetylmuramate--alanine ligase
VAGCDELVYTAAVAENHPELLAARGAGLEISTRMHMLGKIARGARAICVTGAHGKTTTTWLIAHLLLKAQRDPSVLLGGVVKEMQGNVRTGGGPEFVAEVDESDNRLHEVIPTIPILTNVDNDHIEHYGSMEALEKALACFMGSLNAHDPAAVLIGCGDDARVRRVLAAARALSGRHTITYGFKHTCKVRAVRLRELGMGWRFDVISPLGLWPDVTLPMPGEHNVLNALAAISVSLQLGLDSECVREALATTERVGRRFEIKGIRKGIRVIDDYGHHPTEIEATLRAARNSTQRRLGVLFQPHRFTRTAALLPQFARCFNEAEAVFVLPVYSAGEAPIAGVDHNVLAAAIRLRGKALVRVANSRSEAVEQALKWAESGDTLVTQGAGDITRAGDELVSRL